MIAQKHPVISTDQHNFSTDFITVSKFVQWWITDTEMKNKNGKPKIYAFSWLHHQK